MIFPNKSSKHAFAHIYQILQNELKTGRNSQCRYKTQRKFIFALASYVYDIRGTIKFAGRGGKGLLASGSSFAGIKPADEERSRREKSPIQCETDSATTMSFDLCNFEFATY